MADLRELIDAYAQTKAAYDSVPEDDDSPDEFEAYCEAEHAVIAYPCLSMEEVSMKARFFLDNDGPNDTLQNCSVDGDPTLNTFLRALLGETHKAPRKDAA